MFRRRIRRWNSSSFSMGSVTRRSWARKTANVTMPPTSGTRMAGAGPAVARLLDQREHDAAEACRAQDRAEVVDVACRLARRRRHRSPDEQQGDGHQRKVEREDPAPRELVFDDQASRERPDERRNRAPGGPGADRGSTLPCREGGHDDRQRTGDEQRAGRSLQAARRRSASRSSGRARTRARAQPEALPRRARTRAARRRCRPATHRSGSASRAPAGTRSTTHCCAWRPPPRSRSIAGSATLTTVPSMVAIPEPRIAATSVVCCLRVIAVGATERGRPRRLVGRAATLAASRASPPPRAS